MGRRMAETSAGASADRNQEQAERVSRAENHTERRRPGRRKQRETRYRNCWKSRDGLKRRPRRGGVEVATADLIDYAACRGYLAHVHS